MRIARRFTSEGQSPYQSIEFRTTVSEIRNPDGSLVFQLENIEVPAAWSQVACDVLAQKYFRKAGIPAKLKRVPEGGVPEWLWRSVADDSSGSNSGGETDARQVFDRMVGAWTYWGWKGRYFDGEADAAAFYDEMRYMMAAQMGAPNSPQWFNTGLYWAYGIDGPAQGHYYVDHETGELAHCHSCAGKAAPWDRSITRWPGAALPDRSRPSGRRGRRECARRRNPAHCARSLGGKAVRLGRDFRRAERRWLAGSGSSAPQGNRQADIGNW